MEQVLVTRLSEYYGAYVERYIGTIDLASTLLLKDIGDVKEVAQWTCQFHPQRYFGTYSIRNCDKDTGNGPMKWDVLVPVKTDNKGWKAKPGTKYYELLRPDARKKSYLPITHTETSVAKWIEASNDVEGLYSYNYQELIDVCCA